MYEASKEFQAVDDAWAWPVHVRLPVHSIHVPLAYAWQVIPARESV